MKIFTVLTVLLHTFAVSRLVSSASIDRQESAKPAQTAVINLFEPLPESTNAGDTGDVQDDSVDEYYEEYEEDEGYLSGDYGIEVPRVAFSSRPNDPSAVLSSERSGGKRRRGKGRKRGKGKGQGRKRNPCLRRKYKDFCIHGTCMHLKDMNTTSCICHPNYSGERCHLFSLLVTKDEGNYSRTTALAIVAVVLSSLCLTVIAILLAIRYHKRGAYEVENEEKARRRKFYLKKKKEKGNAGKNGESGRMTAFSHGQTDGQEVELWGLNKVFAGSVMTGPETGVRLCVAYRPTSQKQDGLSGSRVG
ncbi:hypothetical protein SKAU_G00366000 [Synaphobranchus kaupii]|uniref:Proheparin-binding EGF-like growth factor n=1 Tax=Synaphobranchus kaupii TaxID=118154 RepID=A0A9Q1IFE4_SYNKA|nr:hypothetical protein SKAU_G00366000 [Synaphobranchus kaupii]